jgi:quinoprotein glucose dehydrogenase
MFMRHILITGSSILTLVLVGAASAPEMQEWPVYAADQAATHYSPLADIDASNVAKLEIAWEWKPGETNQPNGTRPGNFQVTPLMIDNVLYLSTMYNRVIALDAETGEQKWVYDPKAWEAGQPPNGTGFVHRGVAAWRDGSQLRIFLNSRSRLICLDAKTGTPIDSFGDHGAIDLTQGLRWPVDPTRYTNTSPPVVYRNLVILGNGVGDRMTYRQDPPGDVRAFDARTGKQVWSFHTVPQPPEEGVETWGNDSWKITGHTNVWAPMSLDEARGLVYLPVSTPSNDFYGARRPGQNLYGESLVCLDAATGQKKWHFQIVHHGLWDYDPASAPSVVSMNVGGRRIDAVVQLTKQGYAFVFDRVTGKPVWPIEERAVPQSDVAGEKSWPTQPFPSRPPAFAPQGMTLDDVFDLTPELKSAAQVELKKYRLGPLYTPPSVQGTFMQPGIIGGANWGGSAFDPDTNILYVKTSHQPAVARIQPFDRTAPNARPTEVDADYVGNSGGGTNFAPPMPEGAAGGGRGGAGGGGPLPLAKPPYGELVAISLNTGDIAWRVPFGDTPTLRSHPALRGLTLPDRLGVAGAPGVIATKGGLILGGGGDNAFYAFDKKTGKEIWRTELQRRSTSTPMTYRARSGRQFVVMATGSGSNASLVAWGVR